MTGILWTLFADAPVTQTFEFGRIQADYDWWIYGGHIALDPRR